MHKKGLLLVFTTALISGVSIFLNKYSVSVINPYIFTFLKNAMVALIFCAIILSVKNRKAIARLTKKQWLILLVVGFMGGGAAFLLFFKGLSLTSAAQGAFIHKTMFIYIAILAAIFLKEKINKEFILGAALLMLGAFFSMKNLPISFGRGDLLVLIAAILWAIENVIVKYALKNTAVSTIAWARMFFGSLLILGYLAATREITRLAALNYKQALWTLLTAALLFGYIALWYRGLKYLPVSTAAAVLTLGAPITALLTVIAGGAINPRELAANGLILTGLIFIFGFRYCLAGINNIIKKSIYRYE